MPAPRKVKSRARVCQNTAQQNVWNQIFGYDAFGNITKTVPVNGTGTQRPAGATRLDAAASVLQGKLTTTAVKAVDGHGHLVTRTTVMAPMPLKRSYIR